MSIPWDVTSVCAWFIAWKIHDYIYSFQDLVEVAGLSVHTCWIGRLHPSGYALSMTQKCLECRHEFEVIAKESNRGNAKFCSRSCSAKSGNRGRKFIDYTCIRCGLPFQSKAYHAKYCSTKCKAYTSVEKGNLPKQRNHLSARIRREFGLLPCFSCGWDRAMCDVHHVVPRSKGGGNTYDNLTIVCPNCHRLIHLFLLDVNFLPVLSDR